METIPYLPHSSRADEFINHQEILDTLEYARENKNNRTLIERLIDKAAPVQRTHPPGSRSPAGM